MVRAHQRDAAHHLMKSSHTARSARNGAEEMVAASEIAQLDRREAIRLRLNFRLRGIRNRARNSAARQ